MPPRPRTLTSSPACVPVTCQDPARFLRMSLGDRPYLDLLLALAERAAKEDDTEAEREAKSAFTLLSALVTSAKVAYDSHVANAGTDANAAPAAAAIRTALVAQYSRFLALVGARLERTRSNLLRIKARRRHPISTAHFYGPHAHLCVVSFSGWRWQVMEVGLACVHFDAPAVLAAIAAGGPAAEAVGHGFFGRLAQADNVITQGGPRRPSWRSFSSRLVALRPSSLAFSRICTCLVEPRRTSLPRGVGRGGRAPLAGARGRRAPAAPAGGPPPRGGQPHGALRGPGGGRGAGG